MFLIDEPTAEHFAKFKTTLRRDGKPIGDIELFVASVAVHHSLKVITNKTDILSGSRI